MGTSQQNSPISITTPLGDDSLLLRSLSHRSALGQPFEIILDLASEDDEIDLAALIQKPIGIRIDRTEDDAIHLHGMVSRIESLGRNRRLASYRAVLIPAIGLMRHTGGCRMFQDFTVPDIIRKVFSDRGFSGQLEMRLTASYAKRGYCVQYGESDLNFLHRLMEEEGIYYFFEFEHDKHTMILADDLSAHQVAKGYSSVVYRDVVPADLGECLSDWQERREFGIGAFVLNDYDFEKPKSPLLVRQNSVNRDAAFEWFDYPGRYVQSDEGQRLARIRVEAEDAERFKVHLGGNCRGLRSGVLFDLNGHPVDRANQEYLVTSEVFHTQASSLQSGEPGEFRCATEIECLASNVPFRTPLRTPRPAMVGPHLATVCGKEGEEIWTDPYGRVKVKFPWDREGKGDESSSCWMRVAQAWTGKNWGAMSLPRIGDEVIVEFLDGNPDRPIITGRVYNADRMPPEALAAAQSKTIFRTRSTKGADATAFHELTFDDAKDQESIYFHSERDFKRIVENNDSLKVGFEKKSPGDQAIEIYNNQSIEVGQGSGEGSLALAIQKDRTETIATGNDTLTVKQGNKTIQLSQGDLSIKLDAGSATIDAAKSIVIKCGSSKIELSPSSIQISSPSITIKADGALEGSGANATLKASGQLDLEGGIANLKASGPLAVKGAIVQVN